MMRTHSNGTFRSFPNGFSIITFDNSRVSNVGTNKSIEVEIVFLQKDYMELPLSTGSHLLKSQCHAVLDTNPVQQKKDRLYPDVIGN
ncbi:hypothetical protein BLOT_015297 [Blomia tropicalis]|nr:hypothetical protein BLOT_015297 [Blomia tropicalis]